MKNTLRTAYFFLRLPLILLARLLLPAVSGPGGRVGKILLIRIDRMGDLILSLPVVDNLRLKYPGAEIQILVRPYLQDFSGLLPDVRFVVYRPGPAMWTRLRRERYDVVLDLLFDHKLESALLTLLTGAPVRVGFSGGFREFLFTRPVRISAPDRSIALINLELLKPLGVPAKITVPRIKLAGSPKPQEPIVAIHPGGYYPSQRWKPERFRALAESIAEHFSLKVVVLGGPADRPLVEKIVSGNPKITARYPGIKEMAELLSEARLLVCNNSGPLHLAAALGIPTVSTMGPTNPDLWWPQGDRQKVLRKGLPCSPCQRGICPGNDCLDRVSVAEMWQAVQEALTQS